MTETCSRKQKRTYRVHVLLLCWLSC